jgi:hypothetical protein
MAVRTGSIAFVVDDRLSREKGAILTRVVNSMRAYARVDLIRGSLTEEELIRKLEAQTYSLVLAPWYRYLAWSRVEAFYGLTRTSGPTFAGYHCEPLMPYEMGEEADHLRAIVLDFSAGGTQEIGVLVRALMQDTRRAGIRPLLEASTPVYCENWSVSQGLGHRMDAILQLPDIAHTEWAKRGGAIRILLSALWSLVYEEGPGKSEFNQAISATHPRAYFALGADRGALALRLCYSMPCSPKDVLRMFWPSGKAPASPAQLLFRYADLLRVHSVAGTQDLEVVAALLPGAGSQSFHGHVQNLWLEPIAANLVKEVPFELPSPEAKWLKALPAPVAPAAPGDAAAAQTAAKKEAEPTAERFKDRFIFEAAVKIRKLKAQLAERDELIRELKAGGVGVPAPLPPPDAESLLEAFQDRYFEARHLIRKFEDEIAALEAKPGGATSAAATALKQKMDVLAAREASWLRKISATLEEFRRARAEREARKKA